MAPFDKPRQIKYWQRCFKSVLPHHYTPNDSIRLTLGFFIVAALDLLSSPSPAPDSPPLIPVSDRPRIRAWILSLQHRQGGFCGSPNHVLPSLVTRGYELEQVLAVEDDTENANIAATYFALLLLGILGDGGDGGDVFVGVNRASTLRWLRRLQRLDGSFGEVVSADGTISGGNDMRYCYMAATVRWVLCGGEPARDPAGAPDADLDFDVDSFTGHIRRSQTFDGGIADSSMGESHAGYAYCAVAALATLDLSAAEGNGAYIKAGIPNPQALVHWLASRQFAYIEPPETEEDGDDKDNDNDNDNDKVPDMSSLSIADVDSGLTGFNGRLNKVADSCYTWWVSGTLAMLNSDALPSPPAPNVDAAGARAFLLDKMQHALLGGFGKHVERPPDVYHSYLGLASLATLAQSAGVEEDGLGPFDVRLCIGREAANRISRGRLRWVSDRGKGDEN